jgi:hypothetical protein
MDDFLKGDSGQQLIATLWNWRPAIDLAKLTEGT